MRIALFSGNYNYLREGANQAMNQLVAYLERRGHQVRIYSPTTDTPAFEPTGTLISVPSMPLPGRTEFRLGLGLTGRIRSDLCAFAPEIVHVTAPDILNCRAVSFARARSIASVASVHTRYETYAAYYGFGWAKPIIAAHLHRFYRRVDFVLAPTTALAEEMVAVRRDNAVSLWGRGVDTARFDPARRDMGWRRAQGFGDDETVVLFFGRLVKEKGVEAFARTLSILAAKGARVRALIVGAGPAASALAELHGAVFTGYLDGTDLGRAAASADIMLNPSLTEAFGNVVLEGMASGLAIVSPDTPSAAHLLTDGQTGLLCAEPSVAAYAAAISSLIDDPKYRNALGNAAREASLKRDWSTASAQVEQAYYKVLDRRSRCKLRRA